MPGTEQSRTIVRFGPAPVGTEQLAVVEERRLGSAVGCTASLAVVESSVMGSAWYMMRRR